jgi:hypothetical protein
MTFEEYVAWQNAQSVVEPDIVTWSETIPQPDPEPPLTPPPIPPPVEEVPQEDSVME